LTYRIARNGEVYGPYSLMEVERHLASGHILASDLGQPEGAQEWLPVDTLFPTSPAPAARRLPGGLPALFPDPPDLPWWVALLLDVVTFGLFFVVWDIVLTVWMRRVSRTSYAVFFYALAAVLFAFSVPSTWHTVAFNFFDEPRVDPAPIVGLLAACGFVIRLLARFEFRNELLRHFNGPEPIGLRLNAFLTLLFGGLYFQYHFNRINELKRALRISVPAA
jgi:GYF domain 2